MRTLLLNLLSLASVLSLRNSLPFIFIKNKNLIDCFSKTKFFELNCQYLKTEDLITNQNFDNPTVKWPVILNYNRRPKLKKYPFLPVPKMKTTETWNFDIKKNQINGEINTPFLNLQITLKLFENTNKDLQASLTTNINSMSNFLPLKKDVIEEDLSEQINDALKHIIPLLNLHYVKLIK